LIEIPRDTPDELVEDFKACATDPDLAVQAFFRIRNLDGQLVQFLYNRAQRLQVQREKASGKRFFRVLKARKLGISSRRFARDLWRCGTQKNQHRIMLAQDDDAVARLLDDKIMPLLRDSLIPLNGVYRRSESMIYFPDTDSRYYVGTAGSRTFGRGDDINGRHFLETAHWKKPDVIAGVDEAQEGIADADGLDETTANGYNFWKPGWERAKQGTTRECAIFLPWMVHEAYEADATGLVTAGEEAEIMSALGLSPRQLAWRRQKIASMQDHALFPQEYPETDAQAFISSGRPVFDWIGLARAKSRVESPKLRGSLRRTGNRIEFVDDPKYGDEVPESQRGPLKVWRTPQPRHVYAIGSDVAEGIEGGAYSTGEVIDLNDGCQVAEWHGHISADLLADELALISAWYYQAVIITEARPGPGGITQSRLEEIEANVWINPYKDADRGGITGWDTNKRTKPLIVASLNAAIRDHELTVKSAALLDECHAYHYLPSGDMAPSVGQFSDRLMGMAIVWYATREMAAKINLDRAPHLNEIGKGARGGTTQPRFSGPRFGVRKE
jgi:hypothetical protein